MQHTIAIASGKGGTGKTTVSLALYSVFSRESDRQVHLVDCDVEEPNDVLFFDNPPLHSSREVFKQVPEIDTNKCTYCRKCVEYCEFNAIVVIPGVGFAEVNPDLCHSCGACLEACSFDAMTELPVSIGRINSYLVNQYDQLSEGVLRIGSTMQTMLIREMKKGLNRSDSLQIFDAPPGTSCPVVESISDADYIVLVTEPTPFGLHDLQIMVSLTKKLELPFGVVINKAGIGDDRVYNWLKQNEIELLGEIPFSREFATIYASGKIQQEMPGAYEEIFMKIKLKIEQSLAR